MAKEIRTIELENDVVASYLSLIQHFGWELKSSQRVFNQSTRPVGGISYENVTYIHSETETIDFTQLTLERDTKQPHYQRLVTLEQEFMELLDNCPDERPHEPTNVLDIESWTKRIMPRIVSKKWFIFPWIFSTFILFFGFCFAISGLNFQEIDGISDAIQATYELITIEFISGAWIQPLALFCVLSIPIALLIRHIKNYILLKKLLRKHTCQNHAKLSEKYQAYRHGFDLQLEKIQFFDYAQQRMSEIIQETKMLLNI